MMESGEEQETAVRVQKPHQILLTPISPSNFSILPSFGNTAEKTS